MTKILFVDDEPRVLEGLQRFLRSQRLDCEHEAVTSAQDALDCLAVGDIDVVVSDVRMPQMSGVALLERIKSDPKMCHIPVIMLTGHAEPGEKQAVLKLGAYDFVNKPADPVELAARLRSALRMKAYEDGLRNNNKTLERQLIQAQRLEMVGLLASGIFHDLNNILTSIIGHAELASFSTNGDSDLEENLRLTLESADYATKLVQQILHLGGLRRSNGENQDFARVIDDSLKLLAMSIPLDIRVNWTKPELSKNVQIDRTQIFQVVMNLCTNAVNAMNGSGELTIKLFEAEITDGQESHMGEITPGEYVILEVSDTGVGVEPSQLDTIFDPLFTTERDQFGSGLGLVVVRNILNSIGGCVLVRSILGEGATFTACFPCEVSEDGTVNESGKGQAYADKDKHSVC